jgi:hypothetical protein
VTALTWALETSNPRRFPSIDDAMSCCGLTSALVASAGKQQRGPISKQRNRQFANRADRSGQAGAAVEQAVGRAPRAGTETRQSQPRNAGSGAEAGGVSVGGGQIRQTVRGPHAAHKGIGGTEGSLKPCVALQQLVSDPPAVPGIYGAARRRFFSRCATQPVSRPAGLPKFNLRGRRYAVPANGCGTHASVSGHAHALAQFVTDLQSQIVARSMQFYPGASKPSGECREKCVSP